ncbi:MAG: DNA helicase UvrD [Methanobacteriota archaeon]|nr:MAG: DNA helicase UvrD [Euryarchaeota archaeon]
MKIIADFHIHTKYSAATSPRLNIDGMVDGAKKKGISLLASGDFTHPLWLKEMEEKLVDERDGLYYYNGVYFIQSVEVSNIFSINNRTYKMHTVLLAPSLEVVKQINDVLSKHGKLEEDGRPTLNYSLNEMVDELKSISKEIAMIPAHIWTPWFSLFGSKFGADNIKEIVEDSSLIIGLETGLSSDPPMNWMLSSLDKFTLVSNSDAHSPESLGREANLLEVEKLSYKSIVEGIRTGEAMVKTYEYFPQEGKYFFDGHRKCNICMAPEEAMKFNNRCPVCGKPLTIGVMHRVMSLADRPYGKKKENAKPFRHIIPIDQIIAKVVGKAKTTKTVKEEYDKLIRYFGSEFSIYEASEDSIRLGAKPEIAEAIIRVNKGDVLWHEGYDGIFGEFSFSEKEGKKGGSKQKNLLDF